MEKMNIKYIEIYIILPTFIFCKMVPFWGNFGVTLG